MFVHSVYFWLKSGLEQSDIVNFKAAVEPLGAINTVKEIYVGEAVKSDDEVVDSSFTVALTLLFENKTDHDRYQIDPLHIKFIDKFNYLWAKVLVYDSE